MHPIDPDQFVVNLLSLCIFPFAARPMLMALLGIDDRASSGSSTPRRSSVRSS